MSKIYSKVQNNDYCVEQWQEKKFFWNKQKPWTETFKFEYIVHQNNMKTSYYVQRMMEMWFSFKIANQFKHHYEL